MPLLIKYTAECDCGGTMTSTELDLTQDGGDRVTINLDMLGDFTIECGACGDEGWVPAISDLIMDVEK
jgi:hypothetical protein